MVIPAGRPLRYAITDLSVPLFDAPLQRRMRLREQIHHWAVDGVDVVQLREKGLSACELLHLAQAAMEQLASLAAAGFTAPRLLINGRPDLALAARADGVHLTAALGELTPGQVRLVCRKAAGRQCLISVSCHNPAEAASAHQAGANLILFGPVYEKFVNGETVVAGQGLEALRQACAAAETTPVLALGGITAERLSACLQAGAAGAAAIRMFGSGTPARNRDSAGT